MTCTLSWCKVSQQLEERCLEFGFEKHGCAKSLVHSVCRGLLILMAFELVPWNRGMELLAKLVECFVMGQGMCDRNVLFSQNGIFPDMEA